MNRIVNLLAIATLVVSCQKKAWKLERKIELDNVNPIGITVSNQQIWLADGNGNRLVAISQDGKITDEIKNLERPMHISSYGDNLLVPEYGEDRINIIQPAGKRETLPSSNLDAPASVHQQGNDIAIADFYHHQIQLFHQGKWKSLGTKGSEPGTFNYPTDVQIVGELLFIADAYNHRVQVWNLDGTFSHTIGEDQSINAATGIYVTNNEVYVTDFENHRVLLFNHKGTLLQELNTEIQTPTDIIIHNKKLWILNFKEGSVSVYIR